MTTAPSRPGQAVDTPPRSSNFRPDIQGLRAIAVGVVLVYHAGAPFLPGGFIGVDAFFVISGFLITGLLLREVNEHGRISLTDFYARRIKRIVPAATVVLIFAAIGTVLLMPRTRWEDTAKEIIGSAAYFVNWILAGSTNYLNSEVRPSPVQHFWTLSVEEQFYIVWPLLLVAIVALARSGRGGSRSAVRSRLIAAGVMVVTVPSLVWSIFLTSTDPGPAYFVTTTRLWELGIGAMVAVFATGLSRIPRLVGTYVGWTGLGGILAAAIFYTSSTPFPGYQALLPTLGTAAVIIGGMSGRANTGVGRLLGLRPMLWVGNISYSLYLWHWPLIVFATYALSTLEVWQGAAIVLAAFVPAWLSYRFVEQPFQRSSLVAESNSRAITLGICMMLVSIIAAMGIVLQPKPVDMTTPLTEINFDTGQVTRAAIGAEKLAEDPSTGDPVDDPVGGFFPSAEAAADDNPSVYDDGCHLEVNEVTPRHCTYGDADSDYVVALVGDSHAAQWVPALQILATANGWRLDTYTKSICPFIQTLIIEGTTTDSYTECTEWNSAMVDALTGPDRPDYVLLSAARFEAVEGTIAEGYAKAWTQLQDAGLPIAVIKDTPRAESNVPECVSANAHHLSLCAFSKAVANKNGGPDQVEAAQRSNTSLVSMDDMICPQEECAVVIGNVLVYRDSNHLTATYVRSLSPMLQQALSTTTSLRLAAPLPE